MQRAPAKQQCVEVRAAIAIEADDFAIHDRRSTTDRLSNLTIQVRPLLKLVVVAADQAAATIGEVRERAKAVKLQFVMKSSRSNGRGTHSRGM